MTAHNAYKYDSVINAHIKILTNILTLTRPLNIEYVYTGSALKNVRTYSVLKGQVSVFFMYL